MLEFILHKHVGHDMKVVKNYIYPSLCWVERRKYWFLMVFLSFSPLKVHISGSKQKPKIQNV